MPNPNKIVVVIPSTHRLLHEGEPMRATDLIWRHPGQWEEFGNNNDVNFPWDPSYRLMIRKLNL